MEITYKKLGEIIGYTEQTARLYADRFNFRKIREHQKVVLDVSDRDIERLKYFIEKVRNM